MDTTWFAVDRDGHVAAFDSGEAGAVPTDGFLEDWIEVRDELIRAAGREPGDDVDDDEALLAAAGVFHYRHEEFENALAGPYDRVHAPATPLPGHQVPRGLLRKMVSFDGRFADTPRLQPVDHWPSDAWSAAYVSLDGASVRCLPGHEDEYAEQFAELVESLPDATIAPPSVGATPPPPARALPRRRWWQFWKK